MAAIYVSPLADYYYGLLHGSWVELDGKSYDEVLAEILDMMKSSLTEEWIINDYRGFEGIRLGETNDLARVLALAEALKNYGGAFAAFWENQHGRWDTVQDAIKDFEETYRRGE